MNDNCIFCKIANKTISAKIIKENDYAIAFLDLNPVSEGHFLVIPKKHHLDLVTCFKKELTSVIELVQETARLLESTKLEPWGFNYLSNQGKIAGQEINHFHFHVIPKYEKNNGFILNNNINKDDRNLDEIFHIINKKL